MPPAGPAAGQFSVAVVDLSGRIISVSAGIEDIYGFAPDRLIGLSATLVIPEERRAPFADLLERVRAGEHVPFYPTVHRHLDGSEIPLEVAASPVFDGGGAIGGVLLVLRDLRRRDSGALPELADPGPVCSRTGAFVFEVDVSTTPPTWWVCGDRSLVGLNGITHSLVRLAPGELCDEAVSRLLSFIADAVDTRDEGSHIAELAVPGRLRRWLALRAVRTGSAPSSRFVGVAVDVTDHYLGISGEHRDVNQPMTCVIRIRGGQQRRIEYVSASVEHFTGYSAAELLTSGPDALLRCLDPAVLERIERDRELGVMDGATYEYQTFRKDGSSLWVRTRIRIINDGAPDPVTEVTTIDVHNEKLVELEVSRLSLVDALTGLASRKALEQEWELLCRGGGQRSRWGALAHVDIDRFGLVNAGLGMVAGDEMLRVIGQRLRDLAGPDAIVARMGADDFVVLAYDLDSRVAAHGLTNRLVAAGSEPMPIGERVVYATVTVGATLIDPDTLESGPSLDGRLAEAHVALRSAKGRNGGCVEVFAEGMRSEAQAKIETHTALRRGMDQDQFLLHYQPIVDLRTGDLVGAEALVRWEHPTRGLLLPSEFISLAEETGSIVELGGWVIEQACKSAASWPSTPAGEVSVAINLSARQLVAPDLVGRVAEAVERGNLAPDRLVLEITETSVIHDLDGAGWTLRRLADIGVHFALDDFGTGYSSLAYLVQLPIDRVKVDRSLVAGLPQAPHSQAVIAGVVGMAEAMEIKAIAEGVEHEEQIAALNDLGCQLAQGFYFSPPVPDTKLVELINRSPSWR